MPRSTTHFSFLIKFVPALLLIAAADWLWGGAGSWIGGFALAWVLLLLLARPALRRGPAFVAGAIAALLALIMAADPGPLAWVMFWAAVSMAALLPRTAGFDDAWRWALRLFVQAGTGPFAPVTDFARLLHSRRSDGRFTLRSLAKVLALPLIMTSLFVVLFAGANPLVEQALSAIRLPSIERILFWLMVLAVVWPTLRPSRWSTRLAIPDPELTLPGSSTASVLISLALFNTVFAIENGLDIAFLWSGAPLPAGVSMTDYVHRGAYPLIVTALLAGIFVLGTLKPGSATAANPMIRRLVVAWIAQNMLLVASSVLRTVEYVEESMLTPWRIAAFLWMGLVALGLCLICWRMLTGKSARWLINTNAGAAAIVLLGSTIVDFNAMSATWNVRHAAEATGHGPKLDLCFLNDMGSAALLPLIELEQRPLAADFRDRVRTVRHRIVEGRPDWGGTGLAAQQADWRSWTWRGALRLSEAHRRLNGRDEAPLPPAAVAQRDCDGGITPNVPPAPAAANDTPLTEGSGQ